MSYVEPTLEEVKILLDNDVTDREEMAVLRALLKVRYPPLRTIIPVDLAILVLTSG